MNSILPQRRVTPAQQRLVGLLRDVHFGRVQALIVRGGEPVFDPPPVIVRTVKLGAPAAVNSPKAAPQRLTPAAADLLDRIRRLGDGIVHRIQVVDGQPVLAELEERASA